MTTNNAGNEDSNNSIEQRLSRILTNIPEVLVIYDQDLRIKFINDATLAITNRPASDFIGKTEEEIWDPSVYQVYLPALKKALRTKKDQFVSSIVELPENNSRYLEISISPVVDDSGKVTEILGLTRDLTESRDSQIRLDESIQRLNDAEALSGVGSWEYDVSTGEGWWSEGMFKLFQMPSTLLAPSFNDYLNQIHPDDKQLLENALSQLSVGKEPATKDFRTHPNEGKLRWLRPRFEIIKDKSGSILKYRGTLRDITEKRKSEEFQKLLRIAVESTDHAVLITDSTGKIVYVNPAVSRNTGYTESELIGNNPRIFKSEKHDKDFYKRFWETLSNGNVWKGELINKRKNGSIYFEEQSITPLIDEDGKISHFVAIKQNINRRKNRENLSRALNRSAISLQMSNSIEKSFYAVAKELKEFGFHSFYFPVDENEKYIFTRYLSFDPAKQKIVKKLTNIDKQTFKIEIAKNKIWKKLVKNKEAMFIDYPELPLRQSLPKNLRKFSSQIIELLNIPMLIIVPVSVNNKVVGLFSILSNNLRQENITTVVAFADQLATAFEKMNLVDKLKQKINELREANDLSRQREDQNRELLEGTINAIASFSQKKDPYTTGHQKRVTEFAILIANELGLSSDQIEGLRVASILHDIGKIYVPAEILNKPGKLTSTEMDLIKIHPSVAKDILTEIKFPWPVVDIVAQHHERLDGSGYPEGIKGNSILIEAKILSVADVVEAITSHRPYRPAKELSIAISEIKKNSGILYDKEVVKVALRLINKGKFLVN